MERFYLKNYLSKINENTIISFAKNNNIYLSYFEASQALFFIKHHFDDLMNCYDKKEYIYYYFNDPFAFKLYQLVLVALKKISIF